jgi:acetate kinase
MEVKKLSLEKVGDMLYHESGLLGVSGISSDPRVLLEQAPHSPRAASALALYARRFVHEFGACVAALGGIDMLVFTAGIGEHSAAMRERLCAPLAFMGITLDVKANADNAAGPRLISAFHNQTAGQHAAGPHPVAVAVEPTNEEWIAASHAQTLLSA